MKSQFVFSSEKRVGILFLVLFIAGLLGVYFFIDFSSESELDISSQEVLAVQTQIDSLRTAEIEARKPKIYPFNPNYITDHKAYTLGMPTEAFDKLKAFRATNKWVNSAADFQSVTGVSDSLLNAISPYFKFPEWVTNPKPKKQFTYTNSFKEKPFSEKIDLNSATAAQLQQVSGIGPALSERIVKYRDETLGGFSSNTQLNAVYGLKPEVIERTLNLFTVKTPREIAKMNVNTASASDIATIKGISFDMAKDIWEFVKLRDGISNLEELSKIDEITAQKLALIKLYLSIE